jgi:hypothetical protein
MSERILRGSIPFLLFWCLLQALTFKNDLLWSASRGGLLGLGAGVVGLCVATIPQLFYARHFMSRNPGFTSLQVRALFFAKAAFWSFSS